MGEVCTDQRYQDLFAFARALQRSTAVSRLNTSELSRSSTIAQTTLTRYLTLLQMTFLMESLLAWSSNLGKRLINAPKCILLKPDLRSTLPAIHRNV